MMSLLFVVSGAFAAEDPCEDGACSPLVEALAVALAEEGIDDLTSISVEVDATGMSWVTVAAVDKAKIDGLAPKSGAETVLVGKTYERTVPLWLTDGPQPLPTEQLSLNYEDISGGGGGGGGGGDECTEVCVCTEQGPECWVEC